ncbi:MAG: hypothetical protein J2P53_16615, partial [Bradyrhizobiaceae bacterium]|nr:hypothetical protein [Bradyrhizobiaceae bacterium]
IGRRPPGPTPPNGRSSCAQCISVLLMPDISGRGARQHLAAAGVVAAEIVKGQRARTGLR